MDCDRTLLLLMATFALRINRAIQLTMISDNQVHDMIVGNALTLLCEFSAADYNLFDYPVLWRKTQLGEVTQVNIMGNLNEPFMSANRFEVAFVSRAPVYHLELTISDMMQEDSANYTCEVRGPQSITLGQITHTVHVKASVKRLYISNDNISEPIFEVTQTPINLQEHVHSTLRCTSIGGYPPPVLRMYIGQREITDDLQFRSTASVSGRKGLRVISYESERWTHNFLPKDSDDGMKLVCSAAVFDSPPMVESVPLEVYYSPKVKCTSASAHLGDRSAHVTCKVRAKPEVTQLFWIVDSDGTSLKFDDRGPANNDMWTSYSQKENEIKLYFRQVKPESFRRYTLIAVNSIGTTTHDVELTQIYKSTPRRFPAVGATPSYSKNQPAPHREATKRQNPSNKFQRGFSGTTSTNVYNKIHLLVLSTVTNIIWSTSFRIVGLFGVVL